jgi:hypothetical protein
VGTRLGAATARLATLAVDAVGTSHPDGVSGA